jgi:tetraacyldisaccharide 4'-kinase
MPTSPDSSTLESWLTQVWQRRSLAARLLWPLSLLFGALSAVRRALYRCGVLHSYRLPVPVVVVGNVVVGGTGKTPLVIWLVDALQRAGYTPGVISRGYGGKKNRDSATVIEVIVDSSADQVGDEPLLIARRATCPVMVGRDRVAAARALLAAHPAVDVIISDDGLQHYRLQRNVEIVLFDERGGGNRWLLPAGPLRESMARRRDVTVLNGVDMPVGLPSDCLRMRVAGEHAEALSNRSQRMPLHEMNGRILAVAGIGNPQRFFDMLRHAGLLFKTMALPDHHAFTAQTFAGISADVILMTEKDAVKCGSIDGIANDPRMWVVPVAAQLDGALLTLVDNKLILEKSRGYPTA